MCKSLGDYSDTYLTFDLLLLADVFENFRALCSKIYGLDPAHYFGAPGLAWDAMLKFTEIELELLTDIEMLCFIKNNLRGGLVQCNTHFAEANNKFMKTFDPTKPPEVLVYLDANNLYGWAMYQYLPYGGFKWLRRDEIAKFDLSNVSDTSSRGYILEVDIKYPLNLHSSHSDLPFCPQNAIPPNSKNTKLLFFNQKPWMKDYINLNTNLRAQAKNDFEKDYYKLMNNSAFGKAMENVEKRVDVKLVNRWSYESGEKIVLEIL